MVEIPERRRPLVAWLHRHRSELRLSARMTVAALAGYALAELLHLAQGYWAVLTAVVVTQSSVGGSLKASIDRFIGTFSGAIFGAIIALLIPHRSALAPAVALVVAVAPLAVLAAVSPSFRIAPVTAIIVLLGTSSAQAGPLGSATARVIEISLGCVVGLAVSLLVLPARAYRAAGAGTGRALDLLADLLAALVAGLTTKPDGALYRRLHEGVRGAIAALETSATKVEHERRIHLAGGLDAKPLVRGARRLHADLVIIGRAAAVPLPEPMRTRLAPGLAEVSTAIGEFLRGTGAALAERRDPPPIEAVSAALDGYAAAMTELRRERLTRDLSDEEAGRIFALGFGLEQLRRDLDELASRAAEFARPLRRLLSGHAEAE